MVESFRKLVQLGLAPVFFFFLWKYTVSVLQKWWVHISMTCRHNGHNCETRNLQGWKMHRTGRKLLSKTVEGQSCSSHQISAITDLFHLPSVLMFSSVSLPNLSSKTPTFLAGLVSANTHFPSQHCWCLVGTHFQHFQCFPVKVQHSQPVVGFENTPGCQCECFFNYSKADVQGFPLT